MVIFHSYFDITRGYRRFFSQILFPPQEAQLGGNSAKASSGMNGANTEAPELSSELTSKTGRGALDTIKTCQVKGI